MSQIFRCGLLWNGEEFLPNAALVVSHGKVLANTFESSEEETDLGPDSVILPGLINAHVHLDLSFARIPPTDNFILWIIRHGWECLAVVLGLVCGAAVSGRQPLSGRERSTRTGRTFEQPFGARRLLERKRPQSAVRLPRLQRRGLHGQLSRLPMCEGALASALVPQPSCQPA